MATIAQCANHLFLSERRFRELLDQGILDRQAAGGYDLDAVREQYIGHIREMAAGRAASGDGLDLTAERARLAKQQADAQEMKNSVSRGELLSRADVTAVVTSSFARVRSRLLSLPSKLAPVVIASASAGEAKEKISDAVNEALAELADTKVVVSVSEGEGGADGG